MILASESAERDHVEHRNNGIATNLRRIERVDLLDSPDTSGVDETLKRS